MKGVILAGGKGERLRPLTDNLPKPMVEIFGKPLLEYHIELFRKYNIRNILFCLHYLPEKIMGHFGNGKNFGVSIRYSIEKEQMGTAGALKNSEKFFDETFIVMYGDNFTNINLKKLEYFHRKKKGLATIVLIKKRLHEKSSSLILANKNSRIKSFVEKPIEEDIKKVKGSFKYVNAGIYVLEPKILKFIPKKKFDFGHDLFPLLLKNKIILFGYEIPEDTYLNEIGTMQKLEAIRQNAENKN